MAVPIKDSQSGKFSKGQFSRKGLQFRLLPAAHDEFIRLCRERDRIPGELLREIVTEWLEAQKKSSSVVVGDEKITQGFT